MAERKVTGRGKTVYFTERIENLVYAIADRFDDTFSGVIKKAVEYYARHLDMKEED